MKIKLVDDWKDGWKWISSVCIALVVAIETTWVAIPQTLKEYIPAEYLTVISIAILVIGFFGRFIDQGLKNANKHPE